LSLQDDIIVNVAPMHTGVDLMMAMNRRACSENLGPWCIHLQPVYHCREAWEVSTVRQSRM